MFEFLNIVVELKSFKLDRHLNKLLKFNDFCVEFTVREEKRINYLTIDIIDQISNIYTYLYIKMMRETCKSEIEIKNYIYNLVKNKLPFNTNFRHPLLIFCYKVIFSCTEIIKERNY